VPWGDIIDDGDLSSRIAALGERLAVIVAKVKDAPNHIVKRSFKIRPFDDNLTN
jgi:hypothetical protein